MFYFTVLTYPGGIPITLYPSILDFCKQYFNNYIVVVETGEKENNVHINIVYDFKDESTRSSFIKNSTRTFLRIYQGMKLPNNTKFLIKTKKCTSPENVVGGYLQKEATAQILINNGFDLKSMTALAKDNLKTQKPNIMGLVKLIHNEMFNNSEYEDLYNESIQWQQPRETDQLIYPYFREAYGNLIRDGYNVHAYFDQLKKVFSMLLIIYYKFDHPLNVKFEK
jgi:hypothetical protein